jgi:hypothetical protein
MLRTVDGSANAFLGLQNVNGSTTADIEKGPNPMPETMTKLVFILSSLCLVQCTTSRVDPSRPITKADEGKVISERYYEINGVRKVERRIIVTATPRLETKLVTKILP